MLRVIKADLRTTVTLDLGLGFLSCHVKHLAWLMLGPFLSLTIGNFRTPRLGANVDAVEMSWEG